MAKTKKKRHPNADDPNFRDCARPMLYRSDWLEWDFDKGSGCVALFGVSKGERFCCISIQPYMNYWLEWDYMLVHNCEDYGAEPYTESCSFDEAIDELCSIAIGFYAGLIYNTDPPRPVANSQGV